VAKAKLRLWILEVLREVGEPVSPTEVAEALHKKGRLIRVPLRQLACRVAAWLSRYRGRWGIRRVGRGLYTVGGPGKVSAKWKSAVKPPSRPEAAVNHQQPGGPRIEVTPAALERAQRDLVLTLPGDLSGCAELLLHVAQACLAGYAALHEHVHDSGKEGEE